MRYVVWVCISLVAAVVAGWIAILIESLLHYLKALMEVADGSFCFFVSPVSGSIAAITGIITFMVVLSVVSRKMLAGRATNDAETVSAQHGLQCAL